MRPGGFGYPEGMVPTVELSPETESRLVAEARVLGLGVTTYAAMLLKEATSQPAIPQSGRTPQEIRAWLNELAQFSDKIPPMPGETFSREMIYQDHD
jgi:hypothetical protein